MTAPSDTEAHRRDCHARWMLANWPRDRITAWLARQPADLRHDYRERLNANRKTR